MAFRCATEQGTRDGFSNPFFRGSLELSAKILHGWNDGDPFLVNYIGHHHARGRLWISLDAK